MDIQKFVEDSIKAQRVDRLSKSDQLTLGEMILKLEPIVEKYKDLPDDKQPTVNYDFEYLFPTSIDSWRGSYAELALDFTGYDNSNKRPMKVPDFLKMLKDTVGKEFTGYKGGEFVMSKHTPVWVANYGNSGNTAVIDIVDGDYFILIVTAYREF